MVNLEKEEEITSVSADFLQSVGPEIFLPADVVISVSSDGEDFTELIHMENVVSRTPADCIKNYGWKGKSKARYIRYQGSFGQKSPGMDIH